VKVKVLTVVAVLVPLLLVVGMEPAAAAELNVRVTIERVPEIRGFGLGDSPDFYAELTIDGETFDNKNTPEQDEQEGDDDITPNWEFARTTTRRARSPSRSPSPRRTGSYGATMTTPTSLRAGTVISTSI